MESMSPAAHSLYQTALKVIGWHDAIILIQVAIKSGVERDRPRSPRLQLVSLPFA